MAYIGPCCNGVDFPQPLTAGGDYMFINKIYEHLVTYSVDPTTVNNSPGGPYSGGYGPMVPELAASWETAADGLSWTFHLQPNVTFSDGTPFTSADVKFSLEICLNPKAGGCGWAGVINTIAGADALKAGTATELSGVTTPDAQTVVITTTQPHAALGDAMANIWIVQKSSVSKLALDPKTGLDKDAYWFTPGKAIGTGPFKLTGYTAGQFMELSRNDTYWRGKPLLDKIIRKEYKDPATALLAFDKGELDYTYLTADEVKRESDNANAVVLPGPSQVDNAIVFNPTVNPAFANKLFRQAMEYAIDRKSIIDNLYNGRGDLLTCLMGNPAYHGTENTYEYSPDKAKALLQQAGIDPTTIKDITFDTYYNDALSLNVMTAIQANWAAIGFNVTIKQMDGAAWTKHYYNDGASQVSFLGAGNGPDGNVAASYYLSTAAWPNGSNGWKDHFYNNPQADTLIHQGAATFDPAARAAIYQQLCALLADDMPWNVMWQTTRYWIVNKRVGNMVSTPGPGTGTYYDAAEKWYIKQ